MWHHNDLSEAGQYWVLFQQDSRIFEVDVFPRGKGFWYDIRYKEWDHKLDSRPLDEIYILFGGVKGHCPRTGDVPPSL